MTSPLHAFFLGFTTALLPLAIVLAIALTILLRRARTVDGG
jgi:hypothetical protein